ncbi:aspartate/glutamate racemase family protein [Providencia burhodogranariea]|uniref:Aspartate racemase n=1 Tax=Providencia burhodogranariea DSM 19968 TaxID=1141662 RepID=K8WYL1_9GAMM|nr:amino acid racemase [Providencia burhodogranariea]EKT62467.1 aspartate racemase [Providencia burhodogranariea DSM 19968]
MKKILGMLGGMGPGATADAFAKLIANTKASRDQEHIPIIIVSIPDIPDRTESLIYDGPSPLPAMIESLRILESAGVSCIIMPCNTAHYWYEELKKSVSIPFISIIDSACNKIIKENIKSVALLATTATIEAGLYQHKLAENNIKCLIPDDIEQYKIMKSIIAYKAGDFHSAQEIMLSCVSKLEEKGINKFVMGCTEIPLILKNISRQYPEKFIDATDELIKETINWYQFADYSQQQEINEVLISSY